MNCSKSTVIACAVYLTGCILPPVVRAQTDQEIKADVAATLRSAQGKVAFYGRVIDQTGAPIGGVTISASLLSLKDTAGKGTDLTQQEDALALITDANGLFHLTEKTGTSLIINALTKDGYLPAPLKQVEFDFDPDDSPKLHKADPATPVVFQMWQRQGKADLIVWESPNRKLPEDGTSLVLDLIARKIQSASHPLSGIRLKLEVGAQVSSAPSSRFPWKLTLEAISGGILPTTDELMFLAPQSGYGPNCTVTVSATDPDWSDTRTIKCYYTAANGKIFGRVELKVIAIPDAKDGIIAVKSAVNMNGSTNLEP